MSETCFIPTSKVCMGEWWDYDVAKATGKHRDSIRITKTNQARGGGFDVEYKYDRSKDKNLCNTISFKAGDPSPPLDVREAHPMMALDPKPPSYKVTPEQRANIRQREYELAKEQDRDHRAGANHYADVIKYATNLWPLPSPTKIYGRSPLSGFFNTSLGTPYKKPKTSLDELRDEVRDWLGDAFD